MKLDAIMRDDPDLWKGFEYHESIKAYETHDHEQVINETYVLVGDDKDELMKAFTKLLESLVYSARAKGVLGSGRLIAQERHVVEITEKDHQFRLYWRGKIDKIGHIDMVIGGKDNET